MNEFDRRKDASLTLLRKTCIKEINYLPPTFPFLWKLNVQLPPPHFIAFIPLVLIMGLPFGLCALGLYMSGLESTSFAPGIALLVVAFFTLLFGGGIGFYYRRSARLHGLPRWKDL